MALQVARLSIEEIFEYERPTISDLGDLTADISRTILKCIKYNHYCTHIDKYIGTKKKIRFLDGEGKTDTRYC